MALEIINVGASPNDGTGDPIRTAYIKCNNNFSQVYSRYQTSAPVSNVGTAGDTAGMYATDSNYFYYCFADYTGNSTIWAQVAQTSIVSVDSIENGTSNIVASANANITVGVAGISNIAVFANTGVYVTGVINSSGNMTAGNLSTVGSISATGNITGGNVTGGIISASGNTIGGNLLTTGLISASGNIQGNYILGNGSQLTGLPVTYGNSNVSSFLAAFGSNTIVTTSNISSGNLSATGTVQAAYLKGDGYQISNITVGAGSSITNGNSNVNVAANSNVTIAVNGTPSVATFANTGAYLPGLLSATGNIIAGNLQTAGSITATGNIAGGNISATNHTGTTFSASGNITGGNVLTSGTTINSGVSTTGIVSATGNITGGNVTTAGVLTVNSGGAATAIINGGSNASGNIGSSSKYFNTVYASATTALYADLAECYAADAKYAPGTVVKFGGEFEITRCDQDHDIEVAGVVSTNPAYTMNAGLNASEVVTVALVGRVPCLVIGPVRRGQMMVSAGNGQARAENNPKMGAVIGKSLENFNGETGTIEIVVGRL